MNIETNNNLQSATVNFELGLAAERQGDCGKAWDYYIRARDCGPGEELSLNIEDQIVHLQDNFMTEEMECLQVIEAVDLGIRRRNGPEPIDG